MNGNPIQILLIDDDEDDFVFIRDLFNEVSSSQYKVTWVGSYEEGLRNLREKSFDACLLDYRLGEHTGLELLREAQSLGLSCPIIFLTGQGDFDLDVQAMQVGASEYLVKGQLTLPLLERTIRYAMKHALDMRELKEEISRRKEMEAQVLQQDRLASLGLLASSLAHEIGTPLGIIRSRAELAMSQSTQEPIKKNMEIVVGQIDRIAKLVHSLLHLARGHKSDFGTATPLAAIIQDVVNLVQHEFERKNIVFEVHGDTNVIVRAESGPLGQVLLNLLVNSVHAIEAAREQGRTDNHKITLLCTAQQNTVQLCVVDTGCGIAPKDSSQLFKPFFTTKKIGHGSGLGLATSYKLVQSWNGSLNFESRINQGTTFTVTLQRPS